MTFTKIVHILVGMKARLIQSLGNREVEVTKVRLGVMSGIPILFYEDRGKKFVEHLHTEHTFFGTIGWVDDEIKQEIMLLRLT